MLRVQYDRNDGTVVRELVRANASVTVITPQGTITVASLDDPNVQVISITGEKVRTMLKHNGKSIL